MITLIYSKIVSVRNNLLHSVPCFDLLFFFQSSGTRIGRMLTSKDQLARHPRMVNSSEEETQSPVFDRDIANANANGDGADETITIEHNKRGFDAIPQPPENLS